MPPALTLSIKFHHLDYFTRFFPPPTVLHQTTSSLCLTSSVHHPFIRGYERRSSRPDHSIMPVLKSRKDIWAGNVQGTTFTLLHNACQPPLVSLPSSGQASASSTPAAAVPQEAARPVTVLVRAPGVGPAPAPLPVPPSWRPRLGTRRCPYRTGRPKRRSQPERSGHPASVLPRLCTVTSNQPQTHQLSQYRCHLGGEL